MSKKVKRCFVLGDKWLYYKVYCGVHTADLVLEEVISSLTKDLLKKKLIQEWFFVRYKDPDSHLRLRFRLSNLQNIGLVIDMVKSHLLPFFETGLIWKIQTDTYKRELERYGETTIGVSEKIFFKDSELIIKALSILKDEKVYFLFILKCVDCFLTEFLPSRSEKIVFYKENASDFKSEFKIEKITKKSLAKKYRAVNESMKKIMGNTGVTEKFKFIESKLQDRNSSLRFYSEKICSLNDKNLLQIEYNYLLRSYIHMFINKAFRDKQRFYEMLVYDFLYRYIR